MEIAEFMEIFKIEKNYLNNKIFDNVSQYKKSLDKNGFAIVENALDEKIVQKIRENWLEKKTTYGFDPFYNLGCENFSCNFLGNYYRHFEFYWNKPYCKISMDASLLLHYFRNIVAGYNPMHGLFFHPKKVGIYLAITQYPENSGQMAEHIDPNSFLPIHFVLPLSFKSIDYMEGGLFVKKNNKKIDVESKLKIGDLLLFDGKLPHGVDKIKNSPNQTTIGRLQLFAIPTIFKLEKPNIFYRIGSIFYKAIKKNY